MRRMHPSRLAPAVIVAGLLAGACGSIPPDGDPAVSAAEPFEDVTTDTGLDFDHWKGRSGHRYIVETMGSGVALLDHDGDGDLDALLLNGASLGDPKPQLLPTDQLFANQGDGTFEDATARGASRRGADKAGEEGVAWPTATERNAVSGDASAIQASKASRKSIVTGLSGFWAWL